MFSSITAAEPNEVRGRRGSQSTRQTDRTSSRRVSHRFRPQSGASLPDSTVSPADSPTPYQLCVALIQIYRTHSELLNTLDHHRELQRRGLVYREGVHSNPRFIEAYLARQRDKIKQTLHQLQATREHALGLIRLTDAASDADAALETESSAPERFSARFARRPRRAASLPAGSDRVRFQAAPM